MFDRGLVVMPILSVASSSLLAFLSWHERNTAGPITALYATAVVLVLSIGPYTSFMMKNVNGALVEKSDSATSSTVGDAVADAKGDDNTHALVDQWTVHNLVRTVLTGSAGILALWASLSLVSYEH